MCVKTWIQNINADCVIMCEKDMNMYVYKRDKCVSEWINRSVQERFRGFWYMDEFQVVNFSQVSWETLNFHPVTIAALPPRSTRRPKTTQVDGFSWPLYLMRPKQNLGVFSPGRKDDWTQDSQDCELGWMERSRCPIRRLSLWDVFGQETHIRHHAVLRKPWTYP